MYLPTVAYLYLMSLSGIVPTLSCKWGCPLLARTLNQQQEHEASCSMRSIQCPVPVCSSVVMLANMNSHFFTTHYLEVVNSPEACFPISLVQDPPTCLADPDGLKRLCFLQLVDEIMYVISVIVNYQTNEVTVYIQYVEDNREAQPMATLEVCRVDGTPYQWLGPVFPLTYSPVHLTTRRQCLLFHMHTPYPNGPNCYMLHTRIQNSVDPQMVNDKLLYDIQ